MTLKLPPPTYARRGGEIVAAQLRDVGLDVELIPLEWAQWLEEVFKGKDYDLTIVSHTEPLDIDIYARDDYYFHVEDPAFDEIMGKLDAESDPEKRLELLGEAQRRIAENAVNGFLFQLAKIGIWDANLEGLWSNAPVQANDMTKVRWKS
jgi:peptide/nickel transport system substrate-binding protein